MASSNSSSSSLTPLLLSDIDQILNSSSSNSDGSHTDLFNLFIDDGIWSANSANATVTSTSAPSFSPSSSNNVNASTNFYTASSPRSIPASDSSADNTTTTNNNNNIIVSITPVTANSSSTSTDSDNVISPIGSRSVNRRGGLQSRSRPRRIAPFPSSPDTFWRHTPPPSLPPTPASSPSMLSPPIPGPLSPPMLAPVIRQQFTQVTSQARLPLPSPVQTPLLVPSPGLTGPTYVRGRLNARIVAGMSGNFELITSGALEYQVNDRIICVGVFGGESFSM